MDLKVFLKLDGSGFRQGIEDAKNSAGGFAKTLSGDLKSSLFAVFGAAAFSAMIRGAAEFADKILRIRSTLGGTADEIQRWAFAAHMTDTSLESVATAFKKLALARASAESGSQAGAEMAEAFETLGISIERVRTDSPERLAYDIAEASRTAAEDSTAFAAAIKILGRNATEVLPALKELRRGMGGDAPLLDETQLRVLTYEGDKFKQLWYNLKTGAASITASASYSHRGLGFLLDDLMGLAKVPLKAFTDNTTTLREEWQKFMLEHNTRRWAHKDLPFFTKRGGVFGVDQGQGPPGASVPKGVKLNVTTEELVEAANRYREAEETAAKAAWERLSDEQKIAAILRYQAELRKDMETASYVESADLKLGLAKSEEELVALRNKHREQKPIDPKVAKMDVGSDALISVGNFLGSNMTGAIERVGAETNKILREHTQLLKRIAENGGHSGGIDVPH